MYQEENVAAAPGFQRVALTGADLAIAARFDENRVGLARPHLRMLIVAGNEAAIVDASAGTVQSWQQAVPALNQMASTIRIESAHAPAPLTSAAGRAVAGLYGGMKQKYMATLYNVIGSGATTRTRSTSIFSRPMVAFTAPTTSWKFRAAPLRASTSTPPSGTTR